MLAPHGPFSTFGDLLQKVKLNFCPSLLSYQLIGILEAIINTVVVSDFATVTSEDGWEDEDR